MANEYNGYSKTAEIDAKIKKILTKAPATEFKPKDYIPPSRWIVEPLDEEAAKLNQAPINTEGLHKIVISED